MILENVGVTTDDSIVTFHSRLVPAGSCLRLRVEARGRGVVSGVLRSSGFGRELEVRRATGESPFIVGFGPQGTLTVKDTEYNDINFGFATSSDSLLFQAKGIIGATIAWDFYYRITSQV